MANNSKQTERVPIPSVLVTGGTGFVGSAIIRSLLELHPETQIAVLDLILLDTETLTYRGINHSNVSFIQADILDYPSLLAVFHKVQPTSVIHTAGFVPNTEFRYTRTLEAQTFQINVDGTRNVVTACHAVKVAALVYTSSCCVVIDGFSDNYFPNIDERWPVLGRGQGTIYGESKAAGEAIVLAANHSTNSSTGVQKPDQRVEPGLKTCSVRPATTYGEHDYLLFPTIASIVTDKPVPVETWFQIGPADNLWDVVYVGNSAYAHILALENLLSTDGRESAAGEAFFIQNDGKVTFREFCLAIWWEFSGYMPTYTVVVPTWLIWLVAWLVGWWSWVAGSPTSLSPRSVSDAVAVRYASGEKARRILRYEAPWELGESLRRTCAEYRDRRRREGRHPKSNAELLVERMASEKK